MKREDLRFRFILNAFWKPLDFELPKLEAGVRWRRWVDTALESPPDIVPWREAAPIGEDKYRAEARSVVMLFSGGRG